MIEWLDIVDLWANPAGKAVTGSAVAIMVYMSACARLTTKAMTPKEEVEVPCGMD